jgi:hypothetical protein
MAELKAKKVAAGYATSDPSGLLLKKTKKNDASSRLEIAGGSADMEVDMDGKMADGENCRNLVVIHIKLRLTGSNLWGLKSWRSGGGGTNKVVWCWL